MQADAEIFFEHGRLGKPLVFSVGLHLAFAGLVILFGVILPGGDGGTWGAGGGGDAIGVSLVSNIPLPASPVQTQNVLANDSKGLTKSKPQEKENEPDAIPIPDKSTKIKPKPVTTASKAKPQPQPEEETNEVPFGQGGPVSGPYGTFSANGAKGGFGFQGGGGDFGTTYAWYVRVVQQKVSENWLQVRDRPQHPSGKPRLCAVRHQPFRAADECADRAVQRRSVAGPVGGARYSADRHVRSIYLPDTPATKCTVEFWFDYKR